WSGDCYPSWVAMTRKKVPIIGVNKNAENSDGDSDGFDDLN
ncbi:hypothetical protein Tco_1471958, partial [Tanacetum coccineum]